METPAAPAPETPVAAPDGAQCPRVPGWRRCLRGLRGALPPDVGREVVELVMLAGPVVRARPGSPAPRLPEVPPCLPAATSPPRRSVSPRTPRPPRSGRCTGAVPRAGGSE